MEGLPSDFQHNSALAAIASLIGDNVSDEDVEDKKKSSQLITVDLKSGGGKLRGRLTSAIIGVHTAKKRER